MTEGRVRDEVARLLAAFEARGAVRIEADILQPAETLLDLYGEDIRARAFVTADPLRGEAMLRPDFTVPVVQMHLAGGAETARYTYAGPVFRKQPDADRPVEFEQVGYELFGGSDRAVADAEVFAAFHELLTPHGMMPATGDIGLIRAAVLGLRTSEIRKQALMRHLWRPRRFRALVERYRAVRPVPALAGSPESPEIGLRSRAEVEARLAALALDATVPPLSEGEAALLDAILALKEASGMVLPQLRDIAVDMPAIREAVVGFEARLAALDAVGIDAARVPFEASYGRTTLEYYDGFVFGFVAPARPDLPPVATGGRYDTLTRALGGGRDAASVGGVVRPGLLTELSS